MDWLLFVMGMIGALLVVYLAKEEVIPEFRPLFNIEEREAELKDRCSHTEDTARHIDRIQSKIETGGITHDELEGLRLLLRSSQRELRDEMRRISRLESEIKLNQIISRSIGFTIYVVLGGVFGWLFAERVQIEGLSGDLPSYFGAIVIGATWTSYLSVIGLRRLGKEASEQLEDIKNDILETIRKGTAVGKKKVPDEIITKAAEKFDLGKSAIQRKSKRFL